ncbi:Arc family DNA-binding protein [Brucella sp. JSBI001]|uniref:Arc family DNA-binding protein n=1 Tax=Brucella sp. JSBI001 TaxID=2886044 RepID=UPI002230D437|nr:Arc family DNA-binding protein [Brucella sp. JSBI001]UZD70869.1 Arc family DNA-binding protein [Brucella sp. JSBI001]
MARDDLHFRLRIPEELKNRIEAAAQKNERSMTAEMVARLDESFDTERLMSKMKVELEHHKINTETIHRDISRYKREAEDAYKLYKEYELLYSATAEQLEKREAEFTKTKNELERRISTLNRVADIQGEGLDKFHPLMVFLEDFIEEYQRRMKDYSDKTGLKSVKMPSLEELREMQAKAEKNVDKKA